MRTAATASTTGVIGTISTPVGAPINAPTSVSAGISTGAPAHTVPCLPFGRRTPHGTLRWYLVQVPRGREAATAAKVRRIAGRDVLDDAFVPMRERWFRRDGVWSLQVAPMYPEYFFAATRDVIALDRTLRSLSFPAQVVGTNGHAFAPLAAEAQAWFSRSMDRFHVLRNSVARIENGMLHVESGPLVGQEPRVVKIDRHKRACLVRICDADGGFVLSMPIDVPFKS